MGLMGLVYSSEDRELNEYWSHSELGSGGKGLNIFFISFLDIGSKGQIFHVV
jgi:hypothetical protein